MAKTIFPEWKKILWRLVRTSVSAAVAQTLALKPDWTNPVEAGKTLLVSLVSGFLVALGMAVRDWKDNGITKKLLI